MLEPYRDIDPEPEDVVAGEGLRPFGYALVGALCPEDAEPANLFYATYSDYLRSEHWRKTRRRAVQRSGGMCKRCYAEDCRLEIHHLTYERIGRERESDLIALCASCHAKEHGK